MTQSSNLLICFDESGKNSRDPIQLMGALSVPYNIYQHPNYQAFHDLNKEYSYHWKNYGGDSKSRNGIIKLFELATGLAEYMNFNMIRYKGGDLEKHATDTFNNIYSNKSEIVDNTIYTKLPERICYGLVRGYGIHNNVQVDILIEDSTEYHTRQLDKKLKEALNVHSLYRQENFVIHLCEYRSKGQEIGVEFIDIFLGIVGVILTCPDYETTSNKKKHQVELILRLLKKDLLQPYLNNLRLFELQPATQLYEANIKASVKLFIAKNYSKYIAL